MHTVLGILTGTPLWVYVLLAYLVFVGIKASRPQEVSLIKLCILPTIVLALSLGALHSPLAIAVWALSLVTGGAIGFALNQRRKLRFDRARRRVSYPGDWVTLAVILFVFGTKYFFGYTEATAPQQLQRLSMQLAMLICSGASAGILLGSLSNVLLRYRTAHR